MMVKQLLRGLWAPALALSLPFVGAQPGTADEPSQPGQPAASASGGDQASPSPSAPADTSSSGGQEAAPSAPATSDTGAPSQPAATPESQPATLEAQPKLEDPNAKVEANAEAKTDDAASAETGIKAEDAAKAEADKAATDASDRQNADRNADRNRDDDRRADDRRDGAQRRTTNFRPDRPGQEDMDDRRSDDRNADDRGDRDDRDRGDRDNRDRDDRRGSRTNFGLFFSVGGSGLAIDRLDRSSPFTRAGLRRGDVIVSVNGHHVTRDDDFHRWLHTSNNDRVVLIIDRGGRELTYYVEPEWLVVSDDRVSYDSDQAYDSRYDTRGEAYLGVVLDERHDDGAFVQDVRDGSPAERAGLQRGDQILRLNGRAVRSPDHLTQIVSQMRPGDEVDIEFARGGNHSVTVELGGRQSTTRRYSDDVRYSDETRVSDDADVRYRDRNTDGQIRGEVIIRDGDDRRDNRELRDGSGSSQPRSRPLGGLLRPFRD